MSLDFIGRIWMKDNSFAERLYCFKRGKLYVGYAWDKSMDYDTNIEFLFPKRIKQGFNYKQNDGDYWQSFKYVSKETIQTPAGLYKNCLKMDIYDNAGGTKKTGTVWLAKNIGLVRWEVKNEKTN